MHPRSHTLAMVATAILGFLSLDALAQTSLPKSRTLLEQRVLELKEEARQKSAARAELAKLVEQVKASQQCVGNARPMPSPEIEKLSNGLRSSWQAIVNAKPAVVLDTGRPEYDALERAYNDLQSAINVTDKCLDSLPSRGASEIDRLLLGETNRSNSSIVGELISRYIKTPERALLRSRLDGVQGFLIRFQGEGRTRAQLTAAQVESITKDVESQIRIAADQSGQLRQTAETLKQLGDATERELNLSRQRIEEIDKSVLELDDRLSTGTAATDRQLILAVYMMIGALLVLFLGIKFLSNDIALKIVENRSLVEVVSMAFLLLTIIILGTGEKMPKEAIGTLLGSIAGYIFGRKIADTK